MFSYLPNELIVKILSHCNSCITKQVCSLFYSCSGKVNIFDCVQDSLLNKHFFLLPYLITEYNRKLIYGKMDLFIEHADFSIICWAYELGCVFTSESLYMAIKRNDDMILSWVERKVSYNTKSLNALLENKDYPRFILASSQDNTANSRSIELLAKEGKIELLSHILPTIAINNRALIKALKHKQYETIKFLIEKKYYLSSNLADIIVHDLSSINMFPKVEWTASCCSTAAKLGNLEALKFLRLNKCPWDESTTSMAAYSGNLEVLKWARSMGCRWNVGTCINAAIRGNLKILQWARSKGCSWDENVCSQAALYGHDHIIKWAHSEGCPWNELTCDYAAKNKYFELLQWLIIQGCPFTCDIGVYLAKEGNLTFLRQVRALGCEYTSRTALVSVSHEQIFKEIIINGCPVNNKVWEEIVRLGKLDLLLWLKEREEPCCSIVDLASKHGQLSILKYFLVKPTSYTMAYAAYSGHIYILQYLCMKKYTPNAHVATFAARAGRLDVLKWLKGRKCPFRKAACASAAKEGHLEILKWLRANACPWDIRAVAFARKNKRLNILDWMRQENYIS